VTDATRAIALFVTAFATANRAPILAFVLHAIALLNVMWWVHDVCHDSVFSSRRATRFWGEFASMVFVGTPVLDYQQTVHRIHHGYTNVLGADQALATGPVIWDERMRARTVDSFVAIQAWAWFALVLPLTFPLFLIAAIYQRARARDVRTLALLALRWGAALALARSHPWLLIGPLLLASYALAFVSSLNHFHKPMSDALDPNFARSVAVVTQNLCETGPLATWLTGGLNFHIEHHLFATMPRHNYPVIAPEVRAFCARHGLPYGTCTFLESVASLWGALRRPALVARAQNTPGMQP
jgi:fatty acid desaturase